MNHCRLVCFPLGFLLFMQCILLSSCGSGNNDGETASAADFPDSLKTSFLTWTPVLNGDAAFASSGHSGQMTRVFFNETAAPHFKDEKPLPFSPGSYVAKAVVASSVTPASAATRVYFMLKKSDGYDTDNANWAYAVANLKEGQLVFDATQGKLSGCYECHKAEATWDYVRTVDYYRKQSAQ
jgi:hypothetical protein